MVTSRPAKTASIGDCEPNYFLSQLAYARLESECMIQIVRCHSDTQEVIGNPIRVSAIIFENEY